MTLESRALMTAAAFFVTCGLYLHVLLDDRPEPWLIIPMFVVMSVITAIVAGGRR